MLMLRFFDRNIQSNMGKIIGVCAIRHSHSKNTGGGAWLGVPGEDATRKSVAE